MKGLNKAAAVLTAVAGLAMGQRAVAQRGGGGADAPLSWNNAAGGLASTTTNWAPNQMPVAADDLTFNLFATYTVTFSSLVPTTRSHTYRQGTVALSLASPHTVTNGITIGDTNALTGTVTLTTGTLNSTGSLTVGSVAGSAGLLNVNDDSADLMINGVGADLTVGSNGPGTLNITNGGLVQVADQFIAGNNATGTSTVTVSGAQTLAPFQRSLLNVVGTSSSRFGQGGDATVNISNGALAAFAGSLTVSNGSASASTVTVAGTGGLGGLFNATLDVAGDVLLGRNTSATVAAGAATMNVNANGRLQVGGTLFVAGDPDGGTATLHMANLAGITTNSLNIGTGSTIDLDGGSLTIDGGTFSNSNTTSAPVFGGIDHPVITLTHGASGTLASVATRALTIGGGAGALSASFDVRFGAGLNVTSGDIFIGVDSDDSGSMAINGIGSTMSMAAGTVLVVGQSGGGDYQAEFGGVVSGDQMFIAQNPSSTGALRVENAGSIAQYRRMYVGGSSAAAGGAAVLDINTGAALNMSGASQLLKVWPQGQIMISSGGIVNALSAPIGVFGSMRLDDGAIVHGFSTLVGNGGRITGHPIAVGTATIDSPVSLQNGALLELINGDLTVGRATSSTGFAGQDGSTIDIGANHLTLLDSNLAHIDNLTIAGGTLTAVNGINTVTNCAISGFGLIDADVDFNQGGSITATGSGLRFGGVISRSGGTMSGTTFGFNSGGGYSGNGTITGIVDFDAGSVCTNTGILTMGSAALNFGVTMDGTLHCGSGTVTLLDSNGVGLGTLTTLNGASLVCAQPLTVNFGKTIEGTGFVQTPLLTVNGAIKPADLPSQPPLRGTLNVSGAVSLGVNNTYFCDIDPGIEFATADRIQSSGPATLNGALTVAFIDGYVPQAFQTFDIVVGSSRTGTFSSTSFPPVGAFGPPRVEYLADRARIIMCYVNCDGSLIAPTLTANDFQCFLNKFSAQDPYANCDGSTATPLLTANDFQCFLNKFSAGCN